MDSALKSRIRRRLYQSGTEVACLNTPSLPLTEASVEYFQDSFPGEEGLARLDMPTAAAVSKSKSVSPCSMVVSMLYAKRLRQRNAHYLKAMSSTDVFFISMMMASKYLYDEGVDEEVYNDEWAETTGQEVDDVNHMEMDFLKEMDWQLFVKHEEFETALTAIERRLALKEGVKRGWFTYSELSVLLDWDPVYRLWNQVGVDCTKMVSLLSAVYVTSLVSMMGSAAIALQLSGPLTTATLAVLSLHHPTSTSFAGTTPSLPAAIVFPSVSSVVQENLESNKHAIANNNASALAHEERPRTSEDSFLLWDDSNNFTNPDGDDEDENHGRGIDVEVTVSNLPLPGVEELDTRPNRGVKNRTAKGKSGSALSLWFFDSLLSQVWSILTYSKKSEASSSPLSAHNRRSIDPDHGTNNIHCIKCNRIQSSRKLNSKPPHDLGSSPSSSSNQNSPIPSCITSRLCAELSNKLDAVAEKMNGCVESVRSGLYDSFGLENALDLENRHHPPRRLPLEARLGHSPQVENCPRRCMCRNPDVDGCRQCRSPHSTAVLNSDGVENRCADSSSLEDFCWTASNNKDKNIRGVDLSLLLPSWITDVPILDPVGFFTKNVDSGFVLST